MSLLISYNLSIILIVCWFFNNFVLIQSTRVLTGIKDYLAGFYHWRSLWYWATKECEEYNWSWSKKVYVICPCTEATSLYPRKPRVQVLSSERWYPMEPGEVWTVFPRDTWHFKTMVQGTFSVLQINRPS